MTIFVEQIPQIYTPEIYFDTLRQRQIYVTQHVYIYIYIQILIANLNQASRKIKFYIPRNYPSNWIILQNNWLIQFRSLNLTNILYAFFHRINFVINITRYHLLHLTYTTHTPCKRHTCSTRSTLLPQLTCTTPAPHQT